MPLFSAAEDIAPRRLPFPIPGRSDDAGWQTKQANTNEDEDEEEPLTEPAPLEEPIRQTAAEDDGYVPNVFQSTAPEVPATLRPRYRSVHPESLPRTIPVQRLTAKKTEEPNLPAEAENENTLFRSLRDTYTVNNVSDETADEAGCDSANSCRPAGYKTQKEFFFDGWFNGGIFNNTDIPNKSNNAPLLYNDRNSEPVLNQFYLSFGRRIEQQNRFDIGGRVDLLYGTDYFYTNALGLETKQKEYIFGENTLDPLEAVSRWNPNHGSRRLGTASLYGLSMPQAYGEIRLPVGQGITVKAGHFYSGMGLESAAASHNFFYSHSYSFMYGEPTTLTGGTANVQLNPNTTAILGITQGWDIFAKPRNGVSALAGLELKSIDRLSTLSFLVHSGEESLRQGDNRTNYVLTYKRRLNPDWTYALEHTYGTEKNGALLNSWTGQRSNAHWVSIAQYLQWRWCDTLTLGARFEWFRDNGHSRIQKSPVSDPGYRELSGKDYFGLTFGANWQPVHYITVRPEVRYDWSNVRINGQQGIYSSNTKRDMVSFGIDGIIRF
ncbi:MAG: porin [Planctomycetaceae bacterium]|nr:porin [Planctomycetaceae bacterium]